MYSSRIATLIATVCTFDMAYPKKEKDVFNFCGVGTVETRNGKINKSNEQHSDETEVFLGFVSIFHC